VAQDAAIEVSSLTTYVRILRRRKWLALTAIMLVPTAALILSMLQPAKYTASADVLLSRQNLGNSLNNIVDPSVTIDPQRLVDTQVNVAQAPEVANAVLAAADLPDRTAGQFLSSSSVSAKTGADVLMFRVTDRNAAVATQLATLYAVEYVTFTNRLSTRAIRTARREVAAKMAQLQAEGDTNGAYYDDLASKEQQLATMEALQTGNAVLLKPATGASQIQPRPLRNAMLGLVLGIVLGVGLAFLADHLDTRVRSAGQVAQRLDLPLLARLPEPPRELRREDRLVMAEWPTSPQAEPFRVLATNLDFVTHETQPKTIMVTSAREGEGKSTTAANLAIALARAGRRVALVDLDLRRPFIHEFFKIEREPGLTNLVLAQPTLEAVLVPVHLPGSSRLHPGRSEHTPWSRPGELEVLSTGPIPPNPGEFVRSRGVGRALEQLREAFDFVIVDAAPLLGVGDSLALIPRMDALIVVARLELLRRPVLDELHRVLDGSPAKPLGIVITAAEREGGDGYGYGYGYDYAGAPSSNGHGAQAMVTTDSRGERR
jgi:succinoglycan biosynthesis transport protein ExoP